MEQQAQQSIGCAIAQASFVMAKLWVLFILSSVFYPSLQEYIGERTSIAAIGMPIIYPFVIREVLASNMASLYASNPLVYFWSVCLSEAQAEFIMKQAIYIHITACSKYDYIGIIRTLLGQLVVELVILGLEPSIIRCKARGKLLWHRAQPYIPMEEVPAAQAEVAKLEWQDEVRAACRHDARLGMEYMAHCGVIAAQVATSTEPAAVQQLLLAWILGVSLEVLGDLGGGICKSYLGIRGRGLYLKYWEETGRLPILFFCGQLTFLYILPPFCKLSL